MEKTERTERAFFKDAGALVVGGVLFAVAYNMFLLPGNIYIGGAGGVATLLYHLFGWPTGTVIIAINIPLIIIFAVFFGFRQSVKSIVGIIVTSVFIDAAEYSGLLPMPFPDTAQNQLLCAVFGGMCIGAAIGIIFFRGYTTGGSDIAALLLKLVFRKMSTAAAIFVIDAAVVLTAAVVTRDILAVFYSILSIAASTLTLQLTTGGLERGKTALIFSESYKEISAEIGEVMGRGVTLLDGEGWYTGEKKHVILCVVKRNEIFDLKTLTKKKDPSAFIILTDASETIGEGFKEHLEDVPITPKRTKK